MENNVSISSEVNSSGLVCSSIQVFLFCTIYLVSQALRETLISCEPTGDKFLIHRIVHGKLDLVGLLFLPNPINAAVCLFFATWLLVTARIESMPFTYTHEFHQRSLIDTFSSSLAGERITYVNTAWFAHGQLRPSLPHFRPQIMILRSDRLAILLAARWRCSEFISP